MHFLSGNQLHKIKAREREREKERERERERGGRERGE